MSSHDPRPLGGKLFTLAVRVFYRLLCLVLFLLVSVWYCGLGDVSDPKWRVILGVFG